MYMDNVIIFYRAGGVGTHHIYIYCTRVFLLELSRKAEPGKKKHEEKHDVVYLSIFLLTHNLINFSGTNLLIRATFFVTCLHNIGIILQRSVYMLFSFYYFFPGAPDLHHFPCKNILYT